MRIRGLIAGVASAVGLAACGGSTTTVTQTQSAAAPQQQTVTQTQTQPSSTPAPSSSSGGGGGGQTAPGDLVGKKLNDAEDELDSMGIQYSVDSDGHLVILRGDWGVCSTTPGAGQPVSGAIVLHVGHFSCGA
jgi:hypothetical protein